MKGARPRSLLTRLVHAPDCKEQSLPTGELPNWGARPTLALAGKVSQMAEIVVQARFGFGVSKRGATFPVNENDTGILQWKRHARYPRLVEFQVVWDNDPTRTPRDAAVHAAIEIIGIQIEGYRILAVPRH
jgi:hypothetical protein